MHPQNTRIDSPNPSPFHKLPAWGKSGCSNASMRGGNMFKTSIWSVLAILILTSATAWAALNGDIEGVVKDSRGAVIPGATVTITSVETGAQRILVSDERGHFIATLLPIGEYDVKVDFAAFGTYAQRVLVKR